MKILKILTVVFITFFIASFGYFKKDAIACELIGVTHFNEVSPDFYVDQSIDTSKQVECDTIPTMSKPCLDKCFTTYLTIPKHLARVLLQIAVYYFLYVVHLRGSLPRSWSSKNQFRGKTRCII